MNKEIKSEFRCFCIKDDNVVCIEHKINKKGYYDLPGGKIKEKEISSVESGFNETTGSDIVDPIYRGLIHVEYPKRNYTYRIFIAEDYVGEIKSNSKNNAYLLPISELISKKKKFCSVVLLEDYLTLLLDKTKKFEFKIVSDENENIESLDVNTFN